MWLNTQNINSGKNYTQLFYYCTIILNFIYIYYKHVLVFRHIYFVCIQVRYNVLQSLPDPYFKIFSQIICYYIASECFFVFTFIFVQKSDEFFYTLIPQALPVITNNLK